MNIIIEVQRFNPETDNEPYLQRYEVQLEKTQRILDALMYIARNLDGTPGFRKSCAHGVCGSDAMIINGKEGLACKTLIQDVAKQDGDTISLRPLRHLEIEKDLMVNQEPFLQKLRAVNPYFLAKEPPGEKEYLQSPEQRKAIDEATKCIHCGACYSACPVLDEKPDFLGPAALVQAARFVFDSRDKGLEERLGPIDHPNGVWSCDNHFACTKVCPRGIKITKLINQTKQAIKKYQKS
ncbi:succinate dehydrogenase iron-sulfur subunit [candidate division KSB3 bacterium]|uniref:succinate dehydrogenase n=1 Tax=candidate division KSB3 bacterium TaxID=2044937 RepID=A0A2G6KAZ1_9BACT|nr:MAG: succinate dehydrogenase iron-sulfur subunit [candidate division KSB3 bacterium]